MSEQQPPKTDKSAQEKLEIQAERDRKKAEKLAKKQAGARRSGTDLLAPAKAGSARSASEEGKGEDADLQRSLSVEERYKNFSVGQIFSLEDVAGKPGLKKCQVVFSDQELASGSGGLQVATRAKNVVVGMRIAVALEGARVGSITITDTEIGGIMSQGTICDSAFLGWKGKANAPPAGQAVILPADYTLGSLPPAEPLLAVPAPIAATVGGGESQVEKAVPENTFVAKSGGGGARQESEEEKKKREDAKAYKAAIKAAKAAGLPPPPKPTEKVSVTLASASVSTPTATANPPQIGSSPSVVAQRARGRSTAGGEAGMFPDTDNGSFSGAALGVVNPDGRSPAVKPQGKAPKPALPLPAVVEDTEAERRHAEEEALAQANNPLLNPPKPNFAMEAAKMAQIHPRFAELGVMFRSYQLVGSNARCMALLEALEELVSSSLLLSSATSLDGREATVLLGHVEANVEYLHMCREPCVGMRYIVERFKSTILHYAVSSSTANVLNQCVTSNNNAVEPTLPPSTGSSASLSTMSTAQLQASASGLGGNNISNSTNEVRRQTHSKKHYNPLDFIKEVIEELRETIWSGLTSIVKDFAPQHIRDGDVIMTYGRSSSVEALLKEAKTVGEKRFSVVVIDSAPLFEGRGLSTRLQNIGISVTYGLLSSVCVLAPKCTKAIFGSSAVLQSGDVVSRSGTAMAALAMKKERKPVLFLSELYKLTTSVWLLSLTINEDTRTVTDRVRTKIGQQQPVPRYAYGTYIPQRQTQQALDNDAASSEGPSSPTVSRPFFTTTPTARKVPGSIPLPSERPETPAAGRGHAGGTPPPLTFAGLGLGEDATAGCSSNSVSGAVADDGYLYDITPRSLIDMVVTDIGPLHPTAIASAVRERDEREKGKLTRETTKAGSAWGASGGGVGGAMTPSRNLPN